MFLIQISAIFLGSMSCVSQRSIRENRPLSPVGGTMMTAANAVDVQRTVQPLRNHMTATAAIGIVSQVAFVNPTRVGALRDGLQMMLNMALNPFDIIVI